MNDDTIRQNISDALKDYSTLLEQRDEIDGKLVRLRRLIWAMIDMLPEMERSVFQKELADLAAEMGSLTDSIRETLKLATQRDAFWTAAEVRDHLKDSGFDFSQYASNPLASVNTILRRLKPTEVEMDSRDGVAAFRWKAKTLRSSPG